jgi:hypothetical protein
VATEFCGSNPMNNPQIIIPPQLKCKSSSHATHSILSLWNSITFTLLITLFWPKHQNWKLKMFNHEQLESYDLPHARNMPSLEMNGAVTTWLITQHINLNWIRHILLLNLYPNISVTGLKKTLQLYNTFVTTQHSQHMPWAKSKLRTLFNHTWHSRSCWRYNNTTRKLITTYDTHN